MRIAIVNDLQLACEALRRAVTRLGNHEVAWVALDGKTAVQMAQRDRPDLILMDIIMPGMDGAETTRQIMRESPCPILVVTSTVSGNLSKVYEALGQGALDVVQTPTLSAKGEISGGLPLLDKISRIEALTRSGSPNTKLNSHLPRTPELTPGTSPADKMRFVLIGSSTGGPRVVAEILSGLPEKLPAAVIIAQHVDVDYAPGLARWLGESTKLPVTLAEPDEEIRSSHVYVARSNQHLTVTAGRKFAYVEGTPDMCYRPSVDVLFQSAATCWRDPGIAILLTGMGRDGAVGLAALRKAGWTTIAQDKDSSVVWGMPKAAIELNAASHIIPASAIGSAILTGLNRSPGSSTKSSS